MSPATFFSEPQASAMCREGLYYRATVLSLAHWEALSTDPWALLALELVSSVVRVRPENHSLTVGGNTCYRCVVTTPKPLVSAQYSVDALSICGVNGGEY